LPFDESRRLTGSNLFFDSPGAVLETVGVTVDDALLAGWRARVLRARASLQWPAPVAPTVAPSPRTVERARPIAIRTHAAGTSLAIAAPHDQLFTATEINEWAFCAALLETDRARWDHLESQLVAAAKEAAQQSQPTDPAQRTPIPVAFAAAPPVLEEAAAFARFATLSKIEAQPRLRALLVAAESHELLRVLDDNLLTLGSGQGARTWSLDALPDTGQVPWGELHNVPTAIVTGSNGKTTTVRLLAAFAREQGLRDGFNCTDGLFIAGEQIDSGDYSGPVGTRTVLRDPRVEAAILETARGGILRRGLAVERADVAIITNISPDHFGEYGIDDLAGIAAVKFVVASTIGRAGLLVLNADDPTVRARADQLDCIIGWFSRDHDNTRLQQHRRTGGSTSGVRDGRLIVTWTRGATIEEFDLGAINDMPLTLEGGARYNVSNVAGAALAALELGISASAIRTVLTRFGADPADNPGRLMRYDYRGAQVLIDYAHNPEGLSGLMEVAQRLHRTGRIAVLLGQAGNRPTSDIEALAATAARFRPDFIVVKEMEAMLRGRAPGEVPEILRAALVREGFPGSSIEVRLSELEAVRWLLEWSRPGDVLVLPVHDRGVRAETVAMMGARSADRRR
jgi:cyanophycin synthetase